jgi:hypothetical protein
MIKTGEYTNVIAAGTRGRVEQKSSIVWPKLFPTSTPIHTTRRAQPQSDPFRQSNIAGNESRNKVVGVGKYTNKK